MSSTVWVRGPALTGRCGPSLSRPHAEDRRRRSSNIQRTHESEGRRCNGIPGLVGDVLGVAFGRRPEYSPGGCQVSAQLPAISTATPGDMLRLRHCTKLPVT